MTGSSIAALAAPAITMRPQIAMARTRSTCIIGVGTEGALAVAGVTMAKTTRSSAANAATTRNGSRRPPSSYNQPPITGPMMSPCRLPSQALISCGVSFTSGYTCRKASGSVACIWMGCLPSLYMPPNQLNGTAAFTPGTARIFS